MLASKEINEPVPKLGRNSIISSLQQDTPPKCKTNWLILAKNKQTNKQTESSQLYTLGWLTLLYGVCQQPNDSLLQVSSTGAVTATLGDYEAKILMTSGPSSC